MNYFVKIAIWFICFVFLAEWAFEQITKASTIANVAGFAVVVVITYITIKTDCLTSITFKRNKNEKND